MSRPSRVKQKGCAPDASGRRALAALCLLLVLGVRAIAQDDPPSPPDGAPSVETTAPAENTSASPDESDGSVPPLNFKPVDVKPLTSADLPPSNPLTFSRRLSRTSVAFSRDWRAGRNEYRAIVDREAQASGLPPAVVDAVMAVESGYNPAVVGGDGEIGLMQVLPSTARMMGFTGTSDELAQPEINIHYGTRYLAGAWQRADGDLCTATMKYRAGHGETRFSYLSVDYCTRVRGHLMAQGVAVTGSVPQPTFGGPGGASGSDGAHPRGPAIGRGSKLDFAALNTHLRAMTERQSLHGLP